MRALLSSSAGLSGTKPLRHHGGPEWWRVLSCSTEKTLQDVNSFGKKKSNKEHGL